VKQIHWLLIGALPGKNEVLTSSLASTRLRAGPSVGHLPADCSMSFGDHAPDHASLLLIGKYAPNDPSRHQRWMQAIEHTRARGGKVWVDYTDHHLGAETDKSAFYREVMRQADGAICPSLRIQAELKKFWSGPTEIIEDANDLPLLPPKSALSNPRTLMWFGDPYNLNYLYLAFGIFPRTIPLRLVIVSKPPAPEWIARNAAHAPGNMTFQYCPWSVESMVHTARLADACVIPADPADPRKSGASANRLISALSLGLPVAADLLDSYREFAEHFVDLRSEGFHDLVTDPLKYREMVLQAQGRVVPRFSTDTLGKTWARFLGRQS
jgi:hypothetical protein